MSEPWYQTIGPCASQVRQDVFKYITENFYNEDIKEFDHDFTNELTPQIGIPKQGSLLGFIIKILPVKLLYCSKL